MASRRSLHSAPRPAAITHCYPTPAHFPCPQVVLEGLVCPLTFMLLQSMSFIQCIPHYITHLPFRLPFIRSLFMLPGRLLSHKRILTASSHHRALSHTSLHFGKQALSQAAHSVAFTFGRYISLVIFVRLNFYKHSAVKIASRTIPPSAGPSFTPCISQPHGSI